MDFLLGERKEQKLWSHVERGEEWLTVRRLEKSTRGDGIQCREEERIPWVGKK